MLAVASALVAACSADGPEPERNAVAVGWASWTEATPPALRKPDESMPEPIYRTCEEVPDLTGLEHLCIRTGPLRVADDPLRVCQHVELHPSMGLGEVLFREIYKAVARRRACPRCDVANYSSPVVLNSMTVCLRSMGPPSELAQWRGFAGAVDMRYPARVELADDAPITYRIRVPGRPVLESRTLPPAP